ncbi:hypothetical protein KAR91_53455 [Candidatus Pacearchaeota archaeon]|nr:hypothetical protein [Candidatus Pacearchaeota archaeon]
MDKTYTDGKTIVQAQHKAGAFDALQEIYGHPDIGEIVRIKTFATMDEKDFTEIDPDLKWDENTDLWGNG